MLAQEYAKTLPGEGARVWGSQASGIAGFGIH